MDYYSTIKKTDIMKFKGECIELEKNHSEIHKDTNSMILIICGY